MATVRVAAVQAAPVFLQREATVERAIGLVEKAVDTTPRRAVSFRAAEAPAPPGPAGSGEPGPGEAGGGIGQ